METNLIMSEGAQLFSLLSTTYNAMLRARKKELEPSGISLRQTSVLWVLKVIDRPMTIAELSQIIDRDHQTTAQLLKRMEREGLIERIKGSHKRSAITVALTSKGENVYRQTYKQYEVFDEISNCLSPEERDILKDYLKRLREKAITKIALYPQLPSRLSSMLGM